MQILSLAFSHLIKELILICWLCRYLQNILFVCSLEGQWSVDVCCIVWFLLLFNEIILLQVQGMAMHVFLTAGSVKFNFAMSVKFNFAIKKYKKKKIFVFTSSNSNLYMNDFNLQFYFVLIKILPLVCELTLLYLMLYHKHGK